MNKTIIVSNRLPLQVERSKDGIKVTPSVGGLATGMKSVHRDSNGVWVGWTGLTDEEIDKSLQTQVNTAVEKEQCVGVNLTEDDIENYYYGFSNRTLWPLFHYFLEYTEFDKTAWESYKRVNEKFAKVVISQIEDGDKVWIHDYQLLLLPQLVKAEKPEVSIGFFLHIPFPSYEIFRTFPKRGELLEGMLGADLIGFHTYDYERHFLSSVKRIANKEVKFNKITHDNRIIKVDSFPMGIDYKKFENAALDNQKQNNRQKTEIQRRLDEHLSQSSSTKMVLSIDRLDYTKGIPNRIRAFEYFLNKYPQYREKIRLIMLAVPSRSQVPQYQKLKRETDELVGRINGEFSTVSWTPIWYFYRTMPFKNLIDLYTSSDVALITPVRDGMNLVAKEYVATRTQKDGVLVLSEMTGASIEMSEALLINPFNFEEIADTLKQALEMPVEEQRERMTGLQKRISRYSVEKWAEEFMNALDTAQNVSEYIKAEKLTAEKKSKIIKDINQSQSTLLLLDYDGTLVSFTKKPEEAKPDKELFKLLESIAENPKIEICIISGRDKETLGKWFAHTNYRLISDHGVFYRKNKEWKALEILKNDWMEDVIPILETFVDRTPQSSLEQKSFSVAWHYRNSDLEMAEKRVVEINTVLTSLISNTDLTIMHGNKVLEVKSSKANKGRAALNVLNEKKFDNIIALGDDWTDEYMFEDLPEYAHTIKVGLKKTSAKYYLNKVEEVRSFLNTLTNK
ncbi:bifunctional alpha,alpha-trehalose-phosphate synthase (UDP-forming)/trehalose-phosphatase [Flavobacteriaceae bacterium 14752]|uniref:bifunctional alpha,alpha-trehalose-phosphate synthase (UDP-forming)/trehalose-phosphatase n=1 Tax=Mesohalobacter salilacus TaxID=2491711 RepID=UPI000F632E75|nr:bifunctional alpha,alpha-trehalose-phosphate synthase (UDP-forming)/trehalose-phosphatase [Flavobacteriaceae bacterium 14752]